MTKNGWTGGPGSTAKYGKFIYLSVVAKQTIQKCRGTTGVATLDLWGEMGTLGHMFAAEGSAVTTSSD